jgi:hypothetical protein
MLKWLSLALAALVSSLVMAAPASAQYSNRVKCESWNYQPAQCAVGNIIDVRIAERLGGNCRQGPDWRFDRRSIFVNNGCRAIFDVRVDNYGGGGGYPGGGYPGGGYPGGGYGEVVRCESNDYRTIRCPMNTSGGVRISRQLSNTPCQQGRNWNFDRSSVWVKDGCRAEFIGSVGGGGGGWGGGGGGGSDIIECSSRNYQPARCNVNIRRGASIDRVLGGECIQGRTWGWDNRGIWVNNGCRGRFRIY